MKQLKIKHIHNFIIFKSEKSEEKRWNSATCTFSTMNMYHFYNRKKQVLVRKHGTAVLTKLEKDH